MKTSRILPSSTINRAGVLRGSGLYNSLGRAGAPTLARPSLCALSALRRTSGGASMTIPGGRAPPLCTSVASSVLGASASIMGRSSQATGLRPFALPRPDALNPLPLRSLRRAHKHGVCSGVDWGLWLRGDSEQRRTTIEAQARSDGLRLLRTINDTQAHGQEGARADPTRAAQEAGLDVGSERYQAAMAYLIEQAALLGDEHTAFDVGDQHPHGYASYFFTRRAVKLLEEE